MRNLVFGVALLLAAMFLVLLLTGKRILVFERLVQPGETYVVQDWGDLGAGSTAALVCRYFTGRSIKTQVFWYSPNNIFGKDQCPFVDNQD
jgi:hypothetical protein